MELYVHVRNFVILYLNEHPEKQSYSLFNREWNDFLRYAFKLPENYICAHEFKRLLELVNVKKEFKLDWIDKIKGYLCTYNFYAWCDPRVVPLDMKQLNDNYIEFSNNPSIALVLGILAYLALK